MLNIEIKTQLYSNLTIILLASFLDYIIGDPWGWIHPVQVMGWIISWYKNLIVNHISSKLIKKISGVILGIGLIFGSGFLSWLIIFYCHQFNYFFGLFIQVIILASCFAGKSLNRAAMDVLKPLKGGDLILAREKLSLYVGRDTKNLSEEEIFRAVLETVAENTTDGVTAPLFYGLLGLFFPVVGCVPIAIAYKASSTLDSMIGYKKEPFTDIGWFSAKFEDILTWLPCRLTVLTLAIMSRKPLYHLKRCRQDAIQDPSPNSGWSEAIYASILQVQLGGINTYQGEVRIKPLLGLPIKPINSDSIYQASWLTRACFLLWIFSVTLLLSISNLSLIFYGFK